jgi:hypothetical protein
MSIKIFTSRTKMSERQDGVVQEHIVDRTPGAPASQEIVFVGNMRCSVQSCQPAGRDALRIVVRKI